MNILLFILLTIEQSKELHKIRIEKHDFFVELLYQHVLNNEASEKKIKENHVGNSAKIKLYGHKNTTLQRIETIK